MEAPRRQTRAEGEPSPLIGTHQDEIGGVASMTLTLTDDFQISLLVARHGWSHVTVSTSRDTYSFAVSAEFTRIFDSLLKLCDAVLSGIELSVPFYDEPGGCVWSLKPIDDQRHAVILELYELKCTLGEFERSQLGEPLAILPVKRNALGIMLISELSKYAQLYSEPSFQKGRITFPFNDFSRMLEKWNTSRLVAGPPYLYWESRTSRAPHC